jgi:hypothetical protein
MIDVVVLVWRLFDDLLDGLHGWMDDACTSRLVAQVVAAIADWYVG